MTKVSKQEELFIRTAAAHRLETLAKTLRDSVGVEYILAHRRTDEPRLAILNYKSGGKWRRDPRAITTYDRDTKILAVQNYFDMKVTDHEVALVCHPGDRLLLSDHGIRVIDGDDLP